MLKSMFLKKSFLTMLLIAWRLCCQTIRYRIGKLFMSRKELNMKYYHTYEGPPVVIRTNVWFAATLLLKRFKCDAMPCRAHYKDIYLFRAVLVNWYCYPRWRWQPLGHIITLTPILTMSLLDYIYRRHTQWLRHFMTAWLLCSTFGWTPRHLVIRSRGKSI